MANPAMEVNEAEEIAYFNAPMKHQLAETPHDNRKMMGVPDTGGLDESDGNSGASGDWMGYGHSTVTGGDGGGS